MILIVLFRILIELILFGPSSFVHTIFVPHILAFIWNFLELKAFLKGIIFPYVILIRLLNLFWIMFFSKTKENKPTLTFSTPFLDPGSLHIKSRISRLIK